MDAITHFTLGICTAELVRNKNLGKGFLIWGAAAQCLPDFDTAAAIFLPADRALLLHRGFTHSLLFALLAGLCLARLAFRIYRRSGISFRSVLVFFFAELVLHDLLDVCNSYGTGLLEPFSHHRFSFNLLYVADPLFTISLLIAAIFLLVRNNEYIFRARWAWSALFLAAFYLFYAGVNKIIVNRRLLSDIHARPMKYRGYFTTPAPFNCMLWYVVINTDSCYYTGYSSVFDSQATTISLERHVKNYTLLESVRGKHSVQNLKDFADGYYTISGSASQPYLNVLRFGQVQGWGVPNAPFVLSYPLLSGRYRALLLQKGRVEGWNSGSLKTYLRRIGGE